MQVYKIAILGFLTGVLGVLIVFAPAHWLTYQVLQLSKGYVLLEEPIGTIWDGSAVFILAGGEGSRESRQLPERLSWKLRPVLAFNQWGMRIKLQQPCCFRNGLTFDLTRLDDQWTLVFKTDSSATDMSQESVQLPVGLLSGLGMPWNSFRLEGRLLINLSQWVLTLSHTGLQAHGRGKVDFENLSTKLTTLESIGSFRINLVGDGAIKFTISSDSKNALNLVGDGSLSVDSGLKVRGSVSIADEYEAVLGQLLDVFGQRTGNQVQISIG